MEIKQLAVIEEGLDVFGDDMELPEEITATLMEQAPAIKAIVTKILDNRERIRNARTALSSLKVMLEGEGEDDVREVVNFFDFLASADVVTWNGGKGILDFHHSYQQMQLKRFKAALSRLALRARLSEAMLGEAKREVLEETERWLDEYAFTWGRLSDSLTLTMKKKIKEQLVALDREAGK